MEVRNKTNRKQKLSPARNRKNKVLGRPHSNLSYQQLEERLALDATFSATTTSFTDGTFSRILTIDSFDDVNSDLTIDQGNVSINGGASEDAYIFTLGAGTFIDGGGTPGAGFEIDGNTLKISAGVFGARGASVVLDGSVGVDFVELSQVDVLEQIEFEFLGVSNFQNVGNSLSLNVTGDVNLDNLSVVDNDPAIAAPTMPDADLSVTTTGRILVRKALSNSIENIDSEINLIATGENSDVDIRANVSTNEGSILVSAGAEVRLGSIGTTGSLTSADAGSISVIANTDISSNNNGSITMRNGTFLNAGSGEVTLSTAGSRGGDIRLSSITTSNATSNAVTITSSREVIDNDDANPDIVADSPGAVVNISAVLGVGHRNPLEVEVDSINAENSISGNIELVEGIDGGNINILNLDNQATFGNISVQTVNGTLSLAAGAGGIDAVIGTVTLDANGIGSNVFANSAITTSAGSVRIEADGDVVINASVSTSGGDVDISAGDDIDFGVGGLISSDDGLVTLSADTDGDDNGAIITPESGRLVVTTNSDTVDAFDLETSLREAINSANNSEGPDTITFDESVFIGGAASVIRLTQGELVINEDLSIDGSSGTAVVVSGDAAGNDATLPGTFITDIDASLVTDPAFDPTDPDSPPAIEASLLADNTPVLNFQSLETLTLTNLTVTGGRTSRRGGGIFSDSGSVVLNSSSVSGNIGSGEYRDISFFDPYRAGPYGYGVQVEYTVFERSGGSGLFIGSGDLTLTNSTVSGNGFDNSTFMGLVTNDVRGGSGGGILMGTGDLVITNSTISGNSTDGRGGGIFKGGPSSATITNSTINGNSSTGNGGGFYTGFRNVVTLTNTTISGNHANGEGAGIFSLAGYITLTNSTVVDNSASERGGGISIPVGESLTIINSIVSGNTDNGDAPDVFPSYQAGDLMVVQHSLIGDITGSGITASTGSGNILNQQAMLGPLADNGGLTLTHALLEGSPAIDAGSNALAVDGNGNPLTTDQRGEARIESGTVDIGAVEFGDPFLLGDANLDGMVDFDDISPFITILASDTFLDQADTNRDGIIDFDDISPFITLLATGGTAQSNQGASSFLAVPETASGSSVEPDSIVVTSPVSSSDSGRTISEPFLISIASPVEVPATAYTAAAKSISADTLNSAKSQNRTATAISPSASLALVNNSVALPVVEKSEAPNVDAIVASATPVDIYIGPVTPVFFNRDIVADQNSSLIRSETNEPLATLGSLKGSGPGFSYEQHPATSASIEQTLWTAAELFDTHPESLDDVFDFEFEESLTDLI
ncbi:right-handed parallel beta-helix repeat-containing protein [Mariniblastus sp.]|nr:right-handed parallel beta-helix repeat-containing protein [Mariniblastus sp.]